MGYVAVYVTAKDLSEARKIGEALVKEKLLACVNIIPKVESIYRWKGKVEKEEESLLIGKSRKSLGNKIVKRIQEIHSYSVPCVSIIPIQNGNKSYFKWIDKETK